jgi:hypothetical protein
VVRSSLRYVISTVRQMSAVCRNIGHIADTPRP